MSSDKKHSVLHHIGETVKLRVKDLKQKMPQSQLEQLIKDSHWQPKSMLEIFQAKGLHVIAEIKRASPSKGDIAPDLDPLLVAEEYLQEGAKALSVLTEPLYFKGSTHYLKAIRDRYPQAYLLQKDFVVDPYQLWEARAIGADAILIIVALLGEAGSRQILEEAKNLGLSALVEVHNEEEMHIANAIGAKLIGVNNRDLKDLSISLETSLRLQPLAHSQATLICESGLETQDDLLRMHQAGYRGFLVGTSLMKTGQPGAALRRLLHGEA